MSTGTLWTVAKQDASTHTPHRPIRVPQGRWNTFGKLAGIRDRARIVNQFIAWYVREPGATLPKRPSADEFERLLREPPRRRAKEAGHD